MPRRYTPRNDVLYSEFLLTTNDEVEVTSKVFDANCSHKRYVIHQGGTGAGKTYSTLQYLLYLAAGEKGLVISVVGETLPHLKRGAMRDFRRILQGSSWAAGSKENKNECRFDIGGSTVEFFSADSEAKLRGARRDYLFINECNNIDYESFQQLDVRTRRQTILDFNPVRRFWVHDQLLPSLADEDFVFNKFTYLDNPFLLAEEKRNIERRRGQANWWKVYGEGEIGIEEGVVFSNWTIIPDGKLKIDNEKLKIEDSDNNSSFKTQNLSTGQVDSELPGTLLGYGLDFGFTHSPTALIQVNEYEGELYLHEWLYRTGMQNDELFEFACTHIDIKQLTVADSAEPKTADYLYRKGWSGLKKAEKTKDSVIFGINLLRERRLNVTATSLNLIKELRQYMWDTNKDGAPIHRPVKDNDHAIDAIRYLFAYPKKKNLLVA